MKCLASLELAEETSWSQVKIERMLLASRDELRTVLEEELLEDLPMLSGLVGYMIYDICQYA